MLYDTTIGYVCIVLIMFYLFSAISYALKLNCQVVIPILDWEARTFSTPILGLLIFACIAIFPALVLPSAPCMWIAGMTFGYGYGFLLIVGAASVGMSLPFFIGSLFRHRIHVSCCNNLVTYLGISYGYWTF